MLDKNSESRVHVEAIEEPPPPGQSIAFGLERLGLIAVKAPIMSCIILVVLMIAAVFGIERIKIDEWLFWQVGGFGPMLGQNNHFSRYAPEKIPYAIKRYQDESHRLYRVLDTQLKKQAELGRV